MKTTGMLLLFWIVILNAGCTQVVRPVGKKVVKSFIPDEIFIRTETTEAESRNYFTENGEIDLSKIKFSEYRGAGNKSKHIELIWEMVALSDEKCNRHKAEVMADDKMWNIGMGTITTLFSGAASIVKHIGTTTGLAAGATMTSGIRTLANDEIYQGKLLTVILKAIDKKRKERLEKISTSIREMSESKTEYGYTITEAIHDVQSYHFSCSLIAGLVEIDEALDERKKTRIELTRDIMEINKELKKCEDSKSETQAENCKKLKERHKELVIEKTHATW